MVNRFEILGALLAVLAVGCTTPRTEVVLITNTNLSVPAEIDAFRIEVTNPLGRAMMVSDANLEEGPPPRSLGLVNENGELGPYTVRVIGLLNGGNIVERFAAFHFVRGQTRVLRIDLLDSCVGVTCGEDMTCAEAGCRSVDIAPDELEPFEGLPDSGVLPREDAGPGMDAGPTPVDAGPDPMDAGPDLVDAGPDPVDAGPDPVDAGPGPVDAGPPTDSCVPATETCDGTDEDCDGVADNGFDLTTDRDNCGSCGTRCRGMDGVCCSSVCAPSCP